MIHVLYCVYKMSGSSSALWPDLRSVMVLKCAWASVLSAKMDTCTVQWLVFIVPVVTLQPGGIAQDKHFFFLYISHVEMISFSMYQNIQHE